MIFVLLPLTGAIIGWITNIMAIRMLFRPREPLRLWPLPIVMQGLVPRRRTELAENVADIVAEQLFSVDELTKRLDVPQLQFEVEKLVKNAVEDWCSQKMTLLPSGIRNYCSNMLRDVIAAEVAGQFPSIAQAVFTHMREQVDVRAVVMEKINGLDLAEIEELVKQVAKKELSQIEWLGALLGLIIGLLQAFILWWLA